MRIGLGWHVLEGNGRSLALHDGQTAGYYAFIALDPTSRANVVVLSNTSVDVGDIGVRLLVPARPVGNTPPRP
jgi:hypothetical protein